MRIKNIHIKGLFDTFDHFIPFNQEDRITIIHAPNGFGKTIILKMLYGLLKMDFSIFEKIPFDSFVVKFDDKTEIEISQKKNPLLKDQEYEITYLNKRNKKLSYNPFEKKQDYIHKDFDIYEKYSSISRKELEEVYKKTLEELSLEENSIRSEQTHTKPSKDLDIPLWFVLIRKIIRTHFIETQRLLIIDSTKIMQRIGSGSTSRYITNSVESYETELKDIIEDTLNKYATTSQSLERTFPNRLITQKKQENLTIETIKNELNNLEERRKKLQDVGLWDDDDLQDMSFQIPDNTDSSSLNVLNLYIQDAQEKLTVFDRLEKKIALFKNIINSRFQFKQMSIDREDGFSFLTHKGKNLDSNDLSSGEQHQLVLLYEMLFKVKENDLVLLDEPEISLHITWQEKFLDDLVKIIELNPFDVVITTHAPEIINDRWDLTVGLSKNKENV